MLKLDLEKSEKPEIKLPASMGSEKKQGISRKTSTSDLDYAKGFDCVDDNKLWKIPEKTQIPDLFSCLLRNLQACQEATLRTGHRTMCQFQIGKGVYHGCTLSCGLFNLYSAHHVKCQAGEAQTRIKIAWRNINNRRLAVDTTYMTESGE